MIHDTYLVMYEKDGHTVLRAGEMVIVHNGVENYLRTGEDSVLELSHLDGTTYFVLASNITSWTISSPEYRAAMEHFQLDLKEEQAATKQSLGEWE